MPVFPLFIHTKTAFSAKVVDPAGSYNAKAGFWNRNSEIYPRMFALEESLDSDSYTVHGQTADRGLTCVEAKYISDVASGRVFLFLLRNRKRQTTFVETIAADL